MDKNETNTECPYYNFGGDGTKDRPAYPSEYGARCEKHEEFFVRYGGGKLSPNCYECGLTKPLESNQ